MPRITDEYFRTLEISTLVGCPILCNFCPQELYVSRYLKSVGNVTQRLSTDSFLIILKQLKGSRVSKLLFSGYAENFCNNETPTLIDLAYHNRFEVSVITTGAGITRDAIDQLAAIPFQRFAFSLQPIDGYSRRGISDQSTIWQCLEYAISRLANVQIDVVCRPEDRNTGGITSLRKFAKDNGLPFRLDWHNRAGNLLGEAGPDNMSFSAPTYCSRPLANVVQPNGDVTLCCMDWGLDHVVGNLFQESYKQITNGAIMKGILHKLEVGPIDKVLCRYCHYLEEVTDSWIPITDRRRSQFNPGLTEQ